MILIDSHVTAWLALEPERISAGAQTAINRARANGDTLAICDITMLELAMLARKNRIHLETSLEIFLNEV